MHRVLRPVQPAAKFPVVDKVKFYQMPRLIRRPVGPGELQKTLIPWQNPSQPHDNIVEKYGILEACIAF